MPYWRNQWTICHGSEVQHAVHALELECITCIVKYRSNDYSIYASLVCMAKLLIKHICAAMALVALDQLLHIRQRVRLPLSVRSPISPRFASELAHASQRQELLEPRKARRLGCMPTRCPRALPRPLITRMATRAARVSAAPASSASATVCPSARATSNV